MYADSELSVFRYPIDYVRWFDGLLFRIHADPSQKEKALTHVGRFKVIYEELFPLARLLRLKAGDWARSRFKSVIGSQSYDVEVQDHALRYLEVVSTVYDDAERFRMLKFIREKSVDALGRVMRDDEGKPIAIGDEGGMRLHADLVHERLLLIEAVIKKKSSKSYAERTGLVVYFDDSSIEIDRGDWIRFTSLVESLRASWQPVFDSLYLVGPKGEICVEFHKI